MNRGFKFHVSWYGKSDSNLDYFNLCQQKIVKYNLQKYISLKEKTKHIKQVYQDADFFSLPSFYEGTPNVICEAMSCGCPVICSSVCDNSIYVEEGDNGFLFDPHNPESMAESIGRALLVTDNEYAYMSNQSRNRAERLLSEKTFLDKYIKIIEG